MAGIRRLDVDDINRAMRELDSKIERLRYAYDVEGFKPTRIVLPAAKQVPTSGELAIKDRLLARWDGEQWIYYVDKDYVDEATDTGDTYFEDDGTIVFGGSATVFNDIVCPLIVRATGLNRPALAAFVGNITQYQFEVDDFAEIEAIEFPHSWKEGSEVEIHIHWATGGANDATPRGVKWQIEYGYADMESGQYSGTTTDSAEGTIAANEADRTSHYTTIETFVPTGKKIGSQMVMRLTRIAAAGVAPAADPFALAIGVHIEQDTVGSRLRGSK